MSESDLPVRSMPRLATAVVLPVALLLALCLGLAWQLRELRGENATLRAELTTLMLAQRAAASRESLAADALRRSARLEEALAMMRREPASTTVADAPDVARGAEFERVIAFLREEIKAAHETIERLKQDDQPKKPDGKKGGL